MNIAKIEECVQQVVRDFSPESFIYELLEAYGKPKASTTRLKKGNFNLSKIPGDIVWKKNLLFHPVNGADLHTAIDQLRKSDLVAKHNLRFVIVTDYKTLLAVDTKTTDTLDIPIKDLPKHFDFFLPWAGQEKHRVYNESQADIKAAYRMAKLYDEICKDNPGMATSARHSLNVFLSRILFCFFADDTEIFPVKDMFINSIASHTQEDGSDLDEYLDRLFYAMNKQEQSRSRFPAFIQAFPYVNGGFFADKIKAPKFSRRARKILIECGELNWSEINPDIFGSMIQAVMHPDQRDETGLHYTSVTNIMKVIEPLFLNELREALQVNHDSIKGLERLRARLSNVKIFDPACGSGNFLIIAFKELRKLEMEIFRRLRELNPQYHTLFTLPQIQLTQCFGIEIDDFAHEIAILSLWLAEHQMNVKFKQALGIPVPALPLKQSGHIVCGNATRLNWEKVCPKDDKSEIFVLGNPPYLGARNQNPEQKKDVKIVLGNIRGSNNLDYIACWFIKVADYIKNCNIKSAFVSTNSICQGEQVSLLWPYILIKQDLEIAFAHRSFKWENNAKHNAGVTVVIIGLRNKSHEPKYLFFANNVQVASNINPYLIDAKNTIIHKASESISGLPPMCFGSMPNDGGQLLLTKEDSEKIRITYPNAVEFIKRVYGAEEFISGYEEFCLWVNDLDRQVAEEIPPIAKRIEAVRKLRLASNRSATKKLAELAHRFGEIRHRNTSSIIVPCHTSERREYLPFGFLEKDDIILNSAQAIYDAMPWIFAVISSRMHNVWVKTVAGRIRTDIRYSSSFCYNTFPIPDLSDKQKDTLRTHAFNVLTEREKHPEKTIAQLYDPDKMPAGLRQAHHDMDVAVERCYRSKPFNSNEERLEYLFKLYEEMTQSAPKGKVYA